MPYHNRYVQSNQNQNKKKSTSSSSLSTTIWFFREDLLLRSEKPIVNPYSGEEVELPYLVSQEKNVYVGQYCLHVFYIVCPHNVFLVCACLPLCFKKLKL